MTPYAKVKLLRQALERAVAAMEGLGVPPEALADARAALDQTAPGKPGRPVTYPWATMELGCKFFVPNPPSRTPDEAQKAVYDAAWSYADRNSTGCKFSTHRTRISGLAGVVVTRTR